MSDHGHFLTCGWPRAAEGKAPMTTTAALKVHALRTELDAIEAKAVSEARDLHAEAGPGQRHPDQPQGRLLRCSVVPEGRPRGTGTLNAGASGTAGVEEQAEKVHRMNDGLK